MKKLGFAFIAVSLLFVLLSTIYPYSKAFYVVNGLAFLIFLSGIWAINLHYAPEEKGMPKYDGPPLPPPLKKRKCICNDIDKHFPTGKCEACYEKSIASLKDSDFPDFPQSEPSPPKMPKDRIG
jgi:hypothetical protein